MNLSMNWLADYVSVKDVAIHDYCERLTYTGSKVEGYEVLGDDIQNVVVARIVKMERHPDSDHLFICQISHGGIFRCEISNAFFSYICFLVLKKRLLASNIRSLYTRA